MTYSSIYYRLVETNKQRVVCGGLSIQLYTLKQLKQSHVYYFAVHIDVSEQGGYYDGECDSYCAFFMHIYGVFHLFFLHFFELVALEVVKRLPELAVEFFYSISITQ